MKSNEFFILSRQLYLKLPWYKRYIFRKWYKSNNWDVRKIYQRCLDEAYYILQSEAQSQYVRHEKPVKGRIK